MAQTGYTPILIYSSSTTTNAPAAGNLTNSTLGSELAINIIDGKLFYKDNANVIQVIGWKTTPTTAGGTGLTSYTAGDLLYYATGTTLSKLAIGSSGQWLGSSGTAPQWNAPAALTKTDDTNVTLTLGGSASTALLNAASLTLGWTGQLSVSRGGTGLSTLAANYIPYGNGTGAFQSSSNLTFNGTSLLVGTTSNANSVNFKVYGSSEMASANATFQFWYSGAVQIGTFGQGNYALTGGSSTGMGLWSNTYLSFGAGSSNAEQMRLFGSGGVSIGNTTDPGASNLSVTGTTNSAGFYTVKSSTSLNSTPATLFTCGGSAALYYVGVTWDAGNPAAFTASAIIIWDGSNARIMQSTNGTQVIISLSGANVQAVNNFTTATANWSYMKQSIG
jgi:hypothetical protein